MNEMPSIRVRFTRFWTGFNPQDNFLVQLLSKCGFDIEVVLSKNQECDIEFVSVYTSRVEKMSQARAVVKHRLFGTFQDVEHRYANLNLPNTKNAKRRIWFTGENLRPPYLREFDGYLSFDQNYLEKNAYLPIWYFDAGFFSKHFVERVGISTSINELLEARSILQVPQKFACMFVGNPHSVRFQFAEILENYGKVERFGSAFGNQVQYKYPIGKQFKFTIAFENDHYPGYVTEKLLEAYLCGSIPIYWGDLGDCSPINPEAILVKRRDQSLDDLARQAISLSESEILEKLNQPFLKFIPDTVEIERVILGDLISKPTC